MEELRFEPTFASWQNVARAALARQLAPDAVTWVPADAAQASLGFFQLTDASSSSSPGVVRVPRSFLATAKLVACHRAENTWALLYRVLWRLTHGEPALLAIATDADVIALESRSKDIRRDVHKMRAFVRFREIDAPDGRRFVAWFEPHHRIVELNAPFFVDRFAAMRWSILTPQRCAHWDGDRLTFSPGVPRGSAPAADAAESLWLKYYASIFNPARVKIGAMKKEMAPYYWPHLPEAKLIPGLIAAAGDRTSEMMEASRARVPWPAVFGPAPVPATTVLEEVRVASQACRACPLWRHATCTVFGEGPVSAAIMVVGEQPGDQEDRQGRPFVGPAGLLLNRALAAAGLDRRELYLTNAVKHFKWEPQGKRRLHQKPSAREAAACRPWLAKEIELVRPRLIICLGGTASSSVVGPGIKVTEVRGQCLSTSFGVPALITVHPSSLLRQPDPTRADADFAAFVCDLAKASGA